MFPGWRYGLARPEILTAHHVNKYLKIINGDYTANCVLMVDAINGVYKLTDFSSGVKVYPNPFADKLYFKFPDSGFKKDIKIYNTFGQLLLTKTTHKSHFEIDVSDLLLNKILLVKVFVGETVEYFKVLTNS